MLPISATQKTHTFPLLSAQATGKPGAPHAIPVCPACLRIKVALGWKEWSSFSDSESWSQTGVQRFARREVADEKPEAVVKKTGTAGKYDSNACVVLLARQVRYILIKHCPQPMADCLLCPAQPGAKPQRRPILIGIITSGAEAVRRELELPNGGCLLSRKS